MYCALFKLEVDWQHFCLHSSLSIFRIHGIKRSYKFTTYLWFPNKNKPHFEPSEAPKRQQKKNPKYSMGWFIYLLFFQLEDENISLLLLVFVFVFSSPVSFLILTSEIIESYSYVMCTCVNCTPRELELFNDEDGKNRKSCSHILFHAPTHSLFRLYSPSSSSDSLFVILRNTITRKKRKNGKQFLWRACVAFFVCCSHNKKGRH